MPDLTTYICGIRLRNPLVLASGILGDKWGLLKRVADMGIGCLTTKSFTLKPRSGYATPIVAFTSVGMLNAVGLANPGYLEMGNVLKDLVGKIPIIVSIAGSSVEEFVDIAVFSEENGASAVELNLSCPHVKDMGLEIQHDPDYVGKIVESVSSVLSIPTLIKVGLSDKVIGVVSRALDVGAEGVTAINTVKAMVIDVYARKPVLSNVYGGLSGPAIHPIAVKVVYDIYKEFGVSIIGVGGVMSWRDAVEFLLAGASAVGLGTAIAYRGLNIIREVREGIYRYMDSEGFEAVEDMVGYVHK